MPDWLDKPLINITREMIAKRHTEKVKIKLQKTKYYSELNLIKLFPDSEIIDHANDVTVNTTKKTILF